MKQVEILKEQFAKFESSLENFRKDISQIQENLKSETNRVQRILEEYDRWLAYETHTQEELQV